MPDNALDVFIEDRVAAIINDLKVKLAVINIEVINTKGVEKPRRRTLMTSRNRLPLKMAEAQTPNRRASGYGASHLRQNPRLSARTSDTLKTLSETVCLLSDE
jgi:hypothetical protein